MEKYTETYSFYISTGYVGCRRQEEVEIEFDGTETQDKKNEIIEEEYKDWLYNTCELSWWKKED